MVNKQYEMMNTSDSYRKRTRYEEEELGERDQIKLLLGEIEKLGKNPLYMREQGKKKAEIYKKNKEI